MRGHAMFNVFRCSKYNYDVRQDCYDICSDHDDVHQDCYDVCSDHDDDCFDERFDIHDISPLVGRLWGVA